MRSSLDQDKFLSLTFDKGSLWKWWPLYTILTCHFWSSADESILPDAWMDSTGSGSSSISSSSRSLQSFSWVGDMGFHFFEENHSFRFLCHYHVIKPLTIFLTKAAHDSWHKKVNQKKIRNFPNFLRSHEVKYIRWWGKNSMRALHNQRCQGCTWIKFYHQVQIYMRCRLSNVWSYVLEG